MQADEEIRDRLNRSLQGIEVPLTGENGAIRRGKHLRKRRRALEVVVTATAVAAVGGLLLILAPLSGRRPAVEISPARARRLVTAARIRLSPGITAVAPGEGSIWVSGVQGVSRIDPATNRVVAQIPVAGMGDTSDVAVGEGSVWVSAPDLRPDGSSGNLVRIDPATSRIVATIHVVGGPISGVAVGGGSVWVTGEEPGRLYRIDPVTDRVLGSVMVGGGPGAVVYGAGFVWVSDTGGGSVTQVDPATGTVVNTWGRPNVLAVGVGSLWGTDNDAILRIDPLSGRTVPIPVPRAGGVAVDGTKVWALVSPRSTDRSRYEPIDGTAAVGLIDPRTNRVVGRFLPIRGIQPISIGAQNGSTWIADFDSGVLIRVTAVP